MGIGITDTWFKGDKVLEAIQKIEDGKTYEIGHKIEVCDDAFFSCSSYIDQVIHDVKEDDDLDDRPPILKNVWKLINFRREKHNEDDTYTGNGNTNSYATFEVISNNYLEGTNGIITTTDMYKIIHDKSYGLLRAGKYLINSGGYYGFISGFFIKTVDNHSKIRDTKSNPHGAQITEDVIMVKYNYEGQYEGRMEDGILPKEGTCTLDEIIKNWIIIEEETLPELEKKVKMIEANQDLSTYEDKLAITDGKDELANDTTALVSFNSKEQLDNMHDKIAVKKNIALVLKYSMERIITLKKEELAVVMATKKAELAAVMDHLNQTIAVFHRQMERVNRLIITLELYLGISENIVQIAEGEPAPIDVPIALRQQMLYMDEEFGDPEDGGLEYSTMEKFEDWMIENRAFEKTAPEQKCVVVMRPRRRMKDRGDIHPLIKMKLENLDKMVYIFIRNGENIYRIWTDNLEFTNRLFPKKDELQAMVETMMTAEHDRNKEEIDSYDYRNADEKMNEAESRLFHYKRTMILLQGIIQRTQIFAPLPPTFNLLDVSTHENVVKYIYDDEMLLPDGKKRFIQWLLDLNKGVVKGSRIIIGSINGGANDFKERFGLEWYNEHSAPPMPKAGEYVVKGCKVDMWDWVTERIPEDEYKADQKLKKEDRKYYSHHTNYKYSIGKRLDINDRKDQKCEIDVYPIGEDGQQVRRDWIDDQLRISYNPSDTVYGKWGYEMHERKTNITFQIFPDDDTFFIHYDACSKEEIDFYLNNRVDRQGYLHMMPILWTLKKRLKEEKKWEDGFVEALSHELSTQLSLGDGIVKDEIIQAIKWWKNEVVTIWKRPISKDDLKAHRMIKDKVISRLKKSHKIKIATANNKRAMIFTYTPIKGVHKEETHKFIIFGVFKNEFAEKIKEYTEEHFWRDWDNKCISMAKIKREIAILESGELAKLAANQAGKMEVMPPKP